MTARRYRLNLIKVLMERARRGGWRDVRLFERVLFIASDTRP